MSKYAVLAAMATLSVVVDGAAGAAHEANRAYCESIGDTTQVPYADAPENIKESARAGVRFLMDNPDALDSALHNSWMAFKLADGWVYGPTKDADLKLHPCLVPFGQLPEAQQKKDVLFRATVFKFLDEQLEALTAAAPVMATIETGPVDAVGAEVLPVATEDQGAAPHLDAPAAFAHPASGEAASVPPSVAKAEQHVLHGVVALIKKGGDAIAVQLKDQDHLDRLRAEHGADCVEVQS